MSDEHEVTDPSWFEKPKNINMLIVGLVVVCVLLGAADLFYDKHAHFPIEDMFGFQALFGFVAFVVVVFLGVGLRLIIKRDEDYYDR